MRTDTATTASPRLCWVDATPAGRAELMGRSWLSRSSAEAETHVTFGPAGVSIWSCIGADIRGLLSRAGSRLRRYAVDAHGVRLDFEPGALREAAMLARNIDARSAEAFHGPGYDRVRR